MKTDIQKLTGKPADHLAGAIAKQIILCQSVVVGKLNRIANRYSPKWQRCFLFLLSALIAAANIANLFNDKHSFTARKDNNQKNTTHIGQSSDLPKPKPTDSLTLKNEHYGK